MKHWPKTSPKPSAVASSLREKGEIEMSLSRLLPARLSSLINTVECRRWCSSVNDKGEISQFLKKSEVVEQQKAMSVEISEKKKANSNDGAQLINGFHELVEKEREQLLAEEASSSIQISSGGEILSKSEEAYVLEHQMQVEIPRTSHRVSTNKSGSTAPENQQQDIMELCKFTSNLGLGRSDTSDSSCVSKRVASLVDVSQEKRNKEPELEAKNDPMHKKEVTSDIIPIFVKNGPSNLKQVAHSNSFLPSEATNKWRDVLVKKSVFSNEHHPAKDISIPISLSNSKMDEISSVSTNSSGVEADHRAIDQIVNPKSEKTVPKEFEHFNETSLNTFGKSGDIKSLLECIRELPPQEPSVVRPEEIVVHGSANRYTERNASNSIQAQTDKQPFDRKKRKTPSQGVIGKKENSGLSDKLFEDLNPGGERTEIGDSAPHGFCKSIETKEIASLRKKGNLNKDENASLSEKLSDEKKMTIKFVNIKASESEVSSAFKDCGAITKVVFSSVKSTNFKAAHIYFESKKGRQKALKRSDVIIRDAVVLEATSPKGRERMCIPDLIGYSEVPTSLIKHPSRTIMIKELKHNVSFHDIKEALAFCRSNITGIFFGSSSSVAYVEFETVEGKEIAIEKHSLIVHGERLSILRIDAPRTTIIRIANSHSPKVLSFCKTLGKTRKVLQRTPNIMDVHFAFSEWPRMLEILNSLNGIEIDGQQLIAKPAPVYPPDVLNVLWNQPDGRKHLKTTFNSMLLKVGKDGGVGTVGLTEVVDDFYADVHTKDDSFN